VNSKPLSEAIVNAASLLLTEGSKGRCGYWALREGHIHAKVPAGVKVPEWMHFVIFEHVDWNDDLMKPSVSTVACFSGCEPALARARQMLVCLRAAEQGRTGKVSVKFSLVVELHLAGGDMGACGWLNCETLEVTIFDHAKPKLEEVLEA